MYIDVSSETVSAVAALVQGIVAPADSYSSHVKLAGAVIVVQ